MRTINLTKGLVAIVDDADYDEMNACSWHATTASYAYRWTERPNRVREAMHRRLFGLSPGDKQYVDHINGDTLDNRRCNLRICTNAQNSMNRKRPANNTSGFKGVTLHKKSRKWQASIKAASSRLYLGQYATPEEAHEVYCLWADMLHGKYANYGTHDKG